MLMETISRPAATAPAATAGKRYLFSPLVDFLCLGGGSLLLLPLLLLVPADRYGAAVATTMLLLSNVVNHPHFAHSYQIFYRGFRAKAFSPALGREMQARYLFAGLVAPALLIAFCAFAVARGDVRLLALGANLMGLLVGWHYVKQGYGMLMVDAALKRLFFKDPAKKVLLANCYAVWVFAWLDFNAAISREELWGLHYYSFAVPQPLVIAAGCVAFATSAATLHVLARSWRTNRGLPINGVMAYVASLYLWLAFVRWNPLWLLVVPALHSLQYLLVVWRYQSNFEKAQLAEPDYKKASLSRRLFGSDHRGHLAAFVASGALLGFIGFWGVPLLLSAQVPYDQALFGGTLFLFVFWIVINVHHYFLDNVMWRRENPDTRRYLFG